MNARVAFESRRQWFHILFGGTLLAVAVLLGPEKTRLLYALGLLLGLLVLHAKMSGVRLLGIDFVLKKWERKSALFAGQGAVMYFAGVLFALLFAPFEFALSIIAIVAFGDGFSTLVGLHGKRRLFWNPKKTWEGLAAFIFSATAIAALAVPLWSAVLYATILGILETMHWRTDDNLLLPVAATLLFHVFGL